MRPGGLIDHGCQFRSLGTEVRQTLEVQTEHQRDMLGQVHSRFERMLAIAVTVAVVSSIVGTLVSFHIDGATGPCIVLVQMAVFVLAVLFAPRHGLLRRRKVASAAMPADAAGN